MFVCRNLTLKLAPLATRAHTVTSPHLEILGTPLIRERRIIRPKPGASRYRVAYILRTSKILDLTLRENSGYLA